MSKNILLVIDPQNDFTDAPYTENGITVTAGKLSVTGASLDHERLITLLDKAGDKFDQIHISLDTHTEKHIGHPKFWKQTVNNKLIPIPNSLFSLKIDETTKIITGTNKLKGLIITGVDTETATIDVVPADNNKALLEYVQQYLTWFNDKTTKNTKNLDPMIWFEHCIEGTVGHQVVPALKTKLDDIQSKGGESKVTYHIKGQNNLAEMYSIFKAECVVDNSDMLYNDELKPFIYTGKNQMNDESAPLYETIKIYKNVNTNLNTKLLKQLLGEPGDTQNTVYICGEARTHCVRSSAIDLLEYAVANGYDDSKIIFIRDISSPIPGVANDIVYKMTGVHNTDDEEASAAAGFGKDKYDALFNESYKTYKAQSLTSIEILDKLKASTSGGKSRRNKKTRNNKMQKAGKRRSQRRIKRRRSHRK